MSVTGGRRSKRKDYARFEIPAAVESGLDGAGMSLANLAPSVSKFNAVSRDTRPLEIEANSPDMRTCSTAARSVAMHSESATSGVPAP